MAIHKLAREEVLGRYRLIAQLGRGGMADVFLARRSGIGGFEKLVAIKRMLPSLSADRTFVTMFLNEGRISAQLSHPNVCHCYDLDEVGDTLFLAMEFLRGLAWSEIVPAIPDHPRSSVVRFVAGAIVQVCEGLHHAHTAVGLDGQLRPVVHRDVSPSNLFVTEDGIVKLLDFGVSKVLTTSAATSTGVLKGKLRYMAPEQVHEEPIDVRADLFSLAIVTWEALAGRTLFGRGSDYETMQAVLEAEIPALPGDDGMSARLDATLRRALARDRAHRHSTARELAEDLRVAVAVYGSPMAASEIAAQLRAWLGRSLARRQRDVAELLEPERTFDDTTGERTVPKAPEPAAGVRLRDIAFVVAHDAPAASSVVGDEPGRTEADRDDSLGRHTGVMSPPHVGGGDAAMVTRQVRRLMARDRRGEVSDVTTVAPHKEIGDVTVVDVHGEVSDATVMVPLGGMAAVTAIESSGAQTLPRAPSERDPVGFGLPVWGPVVVMPEPLRWRSWLVPLLVVAAAAIVTGVIIGLLYK